jgi:hypothetical protein
MERDVAGKFTLRREDRLRASKAAAVLDGSTVVVGKLPTFYRYYLVPGLLGILGVSLASSVGNGFLWEFAGMGTGVVSGTAVSFATQSRKQDSLVNSMREGRQEPSNDIVVKKGKVERIDSDGGSLHIVTSRHDFELLGNEKELQRVYETLT